MAETPQKAGQYYILEKIAQGGMAEIYKGLAYDLAGIKKTVCIKKILPHIAASREFIDMLVDEAKIAVKLNHGNIAQIYDLGRVGDDYFIVMEYVDGQTLSRLHKKVLRTAKKIPLPLACYIASEVANGLNYMHRKSDEEGKSLNIVHRDISPQNIMVSYSGTVKIIDFGIAKAAVKVGHTESGILKGKFAYMSPEQTRGDTLDHRSDIFSLGVILHELLTGKRLFKGADNKETLRNVRKGKIAAPSEVNPELPPGLDAIVLKALSRDRRHRYAFASDFQEDLIRFLHLNVGDFRPALLAEYLKTTFREELMLTRQLPLEGGATPHLILDKTHTAIVPDETSEHTAGGHAGIDWREFMLEADWPEEKSVKQTPPEDSDSNSEEESEHTEEKSSIPSFSFTHQVLLWGGGMILTLALLAGGYFGWKYYQSSSGEEEIDNSVVTLPPVATITIQKTEEPKLATITVESQPPGASVYLDDEEIGKTTPAEIVNLQPGKKHELGLYLTNYRFFRTDFQTKGGENQKFHIQLAVDFGSLKVVSEPHGAAVLINEQPVGVTPLTKEELPPGEVLKIEVSLPGFAPYLEEIQVAAGKEHLINIRLDRLPSLPAPPPKPIMDQNDQGNQTGTDRTDDHH